MSVEIELTKLERQLLLFDIISSCEVTEYAEITSRLPIEPRMIQRDIKDLTAAGLIRVKFSRKENGFVHEGTPVFDETAKGRRKEYLVQLNRLGTLMRELYDDDQYFWKSEAEVYYDYDDEGKAYIMDIPTDYFTALDCYYELFPYSSVQTQQRDFEILNRIGRVFCTSTGDYYVENTYYYSDELMEDFGVRRREDGTLVRKVTYSRLLRGRGLLAENG